MIISQIRAGCPGAALLGVWLLILPLSACALNKESLSTDRRAELIRQLEIAKELDEKSETDSRISPFQQKEDFALQAAKADRVIRKLKHGFEVSADEISDAVEVPPRISPQLRAQLIQQLQAARRREKLAEETAHGDDQPFLDELQVHEDETEEVLKSLEIGDDVPWSRIKQALQTP